MPLPPPPKTMGTVLKDSDIVSLRSVEKKPSEKTETQSPLPKSVKSKSKVTPKVKTQTAVVKTTDDEFSLEKKAELHKKQKGKGYRAKTHGKKLFVLDTNVLMHDPVSLFQFEEHDVFLPMVRMSSACILMTMPADETSSTSSSSETSFMPARRPVFSLKTPALMPLPPRVWTR